MTRTNREPLADRVVQAAEAALADHKYACPLDILLSIGWLDGGTLKRWQQGRLDCLEDAIQTRSSRLSKVMELFASWARAKDLVPTETRYVARTPQRQILRFGKNGNEAVERQFRTHWFASDLSHTEQQRLAEKTSRPPELVAIVPLNSDWKCHRCGGTGDLLIMEPPGPVCLRCAGLGDLAFLPAGNALLTRRVSARSARKVAVVRFARRRGRYERQGVLVELDVLAEVRRELGMPDAGQGG
jgi:hypothetical protein